MTQSLRAFPWICNTPMDSSNPIPRRTNSSAHPYSTAQPPPHYQILAQDRAQPASRGQIPPIPPEATLPQGARHVVYRRNSDSQARCGLPQTLRLQCVLLRYCGKTIAKQIGLHCSHVVRGSHHLGGLHHNLMFHTRCPRLAPAQELRKGR